MEARDIFRWERVRYSDSYINHIEEIGTLKLFEEVENRKGNIVGLSYSNFPGVLDILWDDCAHDEKGSPILAKVHVDNLSMLSSYDGDDNEEW